MPVLCVVGARPNFMKMAPVVLELGRRGIPHLLVHTGQHYDERMSRVFFDELGLPAPDVDLEVGSDSHARQTARIMVLFEELCLDRRPELVLVAGDVNSTLAAALVAAKLGIPVGHVEAGLRSFDRTMPEEVNRVLTDHLADLLFTTEESGNANLRREGIAEETIRFVGNCMVDTLERHVERAVAASPWDSFDLAPGGYALLTLHRPSNVDDEATLAQILAGVRAVAERLPVLFPVHPRTARRLTGLADLPGLRLTEPLPYLTFLGLLARARLVLTDSGGIQEETTALGVPCLTLRWNTERPVTLTAGTNRLVGTDPDALRQACDEILAGTWAAGTRPPLWDGRAAERIVAVIAGRYDRGGSPVPESA
jgi:UDP-N-acetylglucosamine 2-epimerase (non-hydrolysing)